MRVLLVAEGGSDELVAECLIQTVNPHASIIKKRLPSRGFQTVKNVLPTCVQAAHFQLYDALIVHFDMDGTLRVGFKDVRESTRRQEADEVVTLEMSRLRDIGRTEALKVVFMNPCETTDAWIDWGCYGGNGRLSERKPRVPLKESLYGNPPIGITEQAKALVPKLINQMTANKDWPVSLRIFIDDVRQILAT